MQNDSLHGMKVCIFVPNLGEGRSEGVLLPNLFFSLGLSIFMLLLSFHVCVHLDLFFPLFGVVKFCGTFVSSNLNIQLLHSSNCLYCFGLDCL